MKKVQRGVFTTGGGSGTTINIGISPVNIDKSFVLINGVSEEGSASTANMQRYRLVNISGSYYIEMWRGSGFYTPIDWAYEVIEFL